MFSNFDLAVEEKQLFYYSSQWTSITKHHPHSIKLEGQLFSKQIPNPYCQYTIKWDFNYIYYIAMLHSHSLFAMNCTKKWTHFGKRFEWYKSCQCQGKVLKDNTLLVICLEKKKKCSINRSDCVALCRRRCLPETLFFAVVDMK